MENNSKSVLITGINRGLGHGLAHACLERGDHVLGLGRQSADDLDSHSRFQFARADVSIASECSVALDRLLEGRPKLNHVILNAGILGPLADMREQSIDTMKEVLNVNLWANKDLLDNLLGRDLKISQIVAISSGAAVNGNRGWGGYSISKAALNMLIKLYSNERDDIHFSALAPGLVDTGMQEQIREMPDETPFVSVAKLKQARGTDAMPNPKVAGQIILKAIDRLPGLTESGSFVDVRKPPLAS